MFKELTPLFRYQPHEYAMKWCLSSEKRMKVFLLYLKLMNWKRNLQRGNIDGKNCCI